MLTTDEFITRCETLLHRGTKPTYTEVFPLCWAYYRLPGEMNSVGGSLHIVLDDCNVSDTDVRFCEQWAEEQDDQAGVALAQVLLLCSRTQRSKMSAHVYDQDDPC